MMLQTINTLTLFRHKKKRERERRQKDAGKRMHAECRQRKRTLRSWVQRDFRHTMYKRDSGKSCYYGRTELLSNQLYVCTRNGKLLILCVGCQLLLRCYSSKNFTGFGRGIRCWWIQLFNFAWNKAIFKNRWLHIINMKQNFKLKDNFSFSIILH